MTAIDDKWRELPWMGAPVDAGGGTGLPSTAPSEVHGAIRVKWAQVGGHSGVLRYPVTDELGCGPGAGRYNHFEGGSIYWRADIGPHAVHGAIRDLWAQMGWQDGRLGYPVSDERGSRDKRASSFQHGTITWTPSGGAVVAWNID